MLDDLSTEEAIIRCGELKIDKEKIPLLLSELGLHEKKELLINLYSPDSIEYKLYEQGEATGELKLALDLDSNMSNPKAKDAYKNLNEERRRQAINKKLKENFGM